MALGSPYMYTGACKERTFMMKLSIIIPALNEEKFLARCIDSILAQNFLDMEILIIDDGSTDRTLSIARQYEKEYSIVHVITHSRKGLGASRNTGIMSAKGKYLLFVDADDYIMPGSLERICCNMVSDLVLLTSCKQKGGVVKSPFNYFLEDDFEGDINVVLPRLVEKKLFFGSACEKAIKREVVLKNQIFFPEGRLKETISWCVRILKSVKSVSFCNVEYYCYIQHENEKKSLSGNISKTSITDILASLSECTELITVSPIETWRKKSCYHFLASSFLFAAEYMADFGDRELEAELKKFLFLLDNSSDRTCIRARIILKVFGFHIGTQLLREISKAKYRRWRMLK